MLPTAPLHWYDRKSAIWSLRYKSKSDVHKRHWGRWNQHPSLWIARYVNIGLGVSVRADNRSFACAPRQDTHTLNYCFHFVFTTNLHYRDCNRIMVSGLSVRHNSSYIVRCSQSLFPMVSWLRAKAEWHLWFGNLPKNLNNDIVKMVVFICHEWRWHSANCWLKVFS